MTEAQLRHYERHEQTAQYMVEDFGGMPNAGYVWAQADQEMMLTYQDPLADVLAKRIISISIALHRGGKFFPKGEREDALATLAMSNGTKNEIILDILPHYADGERKAYAIDYVIGPADGSAIRVEGDLSLAPDDLAKKLYDTAKDLYLAIDLHSSVIEPILGSRPAGVYAGIDVIPLVDYRDEFSRALRSLPIEYVVGEDRSVVMRIKSDHAATMMGGGVMAESPVITSRALQTLCEQDNEARANSRPGPLATWEILQRLAKENSLIPSLDVRGDRYLARFFDEAEPGVMRNTGIAACFHRNGKAIVTFNGVRGVPFHYSRDPETIDSAVRAAICSLIEADLASMGMRICPDLGEVDEDHGPALISIAENDFVDDDDVTDRVRALAVRWGNLSSAAGAAKCRAASVPGM